MYSSVNPKYYHILKYILFLHASWLLFKQNTIPLIFFTIKLLKEKEKRKKEKHILNDKIPGLTYIYWLPAVYHLLQYFHNHQKHWQLSTDQMHSNGSPQPCPYMHKIEIMYCVQNLQKKASKKQISALTSNKQVVTNTKFSPQIKPAWISCLLHSKSHTHKIHKFIPMPSMSEE